MSDQLLSNNPPPEETAGMEISTRLAELDARKAEILGALERVQVSDNHTAGSAADFVSICQHLLRAADAIRREIKTPYDRAVKTVDGRTAAYVEEVERAVAKVEQMIRDFRAEQRRLAANALEEQRAEEARLREAAQKGQLLGADGEVVYDHGQTFPTAAPVSEAEISLPVARGEFGTKVSDQKLKDYRITDVRALPDEILKAPAVERAMIAAIKQLARLRADIPGVEITPIASDKIRRAG